MMVLRGIGEGARMARLMASTALVGLSLAGPVHAAAAEGDARAVQSAQAGATRTFDIPAQALSGALTQFARQSGLQVTMDSAITRGLSSPGVSGAMTPAAALTQLLAGAGITWQMIDAKTVALSRAAAGGAMTLDPVMVEGAASARAMLNDAARTEGSGSYTTTATTVGKEAAAIKDIPRSVSVVTRQMMDDRNVTEVADALKQTPGITVVKYDGGGLRNTIQARGHAIDTVQLDGVSTTWDMNTGTTFDAAIYDRIEVLRGPAGLYQSGGEPGGSLNLARKRALDRWSFGGEAGIGSWDTYRGVIDVTGPLVESGRIRTRIVGVLDDRDSFVDVVGNEKKTVFGTVEGDLTDDTTVALGLTSQRYSNVQNYGLPAYAGGRLLDADRSTFAGAGWNDMDFDIDEQFVELKHRLDGGGEIRLSGRHQAQNAATIGLWANTVVDPATGNFNSVVWGSRRQAEEWSMDGHVSTPLQVGGLTHTLLLGADYRTRQSDATSSNMVSVNGFNISSMNHDPAVPRLTWGTPSRNSVDQYGAYGQARIKPGVDWLTLVGGGRLSWWSTRTKNMATMVESGRYASHGEFTPYGGVVYDASREVSLYVSYAEIFKPQNSLDIHGNMLPPRIGGSWEVGVKGSFLDGRLNTQLAAYRMIDENRAMPIEGCLGDACNEAAGKVRSRGIEAQADGSPWPNWNVSAGYAYVLTDHLTGTAANKGNTFSTATPKHTATLWAKYTFPEGSPMHGLSVGGGMKTVSSFYVMNSAGTRWVQDGYTVFDALVAYAFTETLDASLTVSNLFDETYYEKVGGDNRQNYYGAPRSAMLTLHARF